jgi:hypothetical protein
MQKIILSFIVLILTFSLLLGCTAQAESLESGDENNTVNETASDNVTTSENPLSGTCPFGKTDAECTGECGRFVDNDDDGFCDRGQ